MLVALIAGCTPSGQRPKVDTDENIYAVHQDFGALQARHRKLNEAGHRIASYPMAKAQCWMDVAFHEFTRNDRSRFWTGAMGEAGRLMSALEARQTPPADTPLVNGAARLRDDLWDRAGRLRQHAGFHCVEDKVACLEVHLVHAGNEFNQGGWRYSNPYIRIAEDMLGQAESDARACVPPVKPAPAPETPAPVVPVPTPPAAPAIVPVAPPPTIVRLSADILFAFDRADLASVRPEGRAQLERIIHRLRTDFREIRSVRIEGHTDRLGSDTYNLRLSQARADTIRALLASRSIEASRITAIGRGEQAPITTECQDRLPRAELVTCLAPDRRIEIEIDGIAK